ncbi:hypothetical protein BGW41_006307 [Actinomortierella wolfii]|nr:hypothetical protein BGW41_006307 [Actinomortierella wolfii]
MATTVPDSYAGAVNAMLSSLAEIEDLLEPLFTTSTSLNETLVKLDTEKRCQLELMVAYAINTLAFVNLKTNGTAPNTHPVMKELARIKNYTEKLKNATTVSKPSMNIDKDAADRFIRGALASNNIADKKEESDAAAQKAKEADSTESVSSTPSSSSTKKHKRFDPFQGYENQQQTTSSSRPSASSSTDGPSRKKAKSKQTQIRAMSSLKIVNSPAAPAALGPYSQAIAANGLVFCSGSIPIDPKSGEIVGSDVQAQTRQVFANMTEVLKASNASLSSVVKTTVFLKNMNDFAAMNAVYAELMGDARPARSTVEVARLPKDVLVEIECIAVANN